MRARPRSVAAISSSPTGESTTSKRTSTMPSCSARARNWASSSGETLIGPPQSADAGRRRGPRGLLGRSEDVADLGVGKVVAVAQDDRRALGGGQVAGQVLELLERVEAQLGHGLGVERRLL